MRQLQCRAEDVLIGDEVSDGDRWHTVNDVAVLASFVPSHGPRVLWTIRGRFYWIDRGTVVHVRVETERR